jgi:hypothetical protein
MVKLVRINVSFVSKIKKIFSTLIPSSGQTISSIGLSNISLESVLHKLSFGIKISRLPVTQNPMAKKQTSLKMINLIEIISNLIDSYGFVMNGTYR